MRSSSFILRGFAAAALSVGAAGCGGEGGGSGQASWRGDDGVLAFAYPRGWTEVTGEGAARSSIVEVHEFAPPESTGLQCTLTNRPETLPRPLTQAELNDGLSRMRRVDMEADIAARTRGRGVVRDFEQTSIDGTTAVRSTYEATLNGRRLEIRQLHFWFAVDGGYGAHTFACAGRAPLDEERAATVDAIISSLTITLD